MILILYKITIESMDIIVEKEPTRQVFKSGSNIIGFIPSQSSYEVSKGIQFTDHLIQEQKGIFLWERTYHKIPIHPEKSIRLILEFIANYSPSFTMIPSVMYNGNEWGEGPFPRGFLRKGIPWTFAYHRTAVPGGTYSEGSNWAVALYGTTDVNLFPFSCSLFPQDQQTVHRLIWPEEEQPDVYLMRVYRGHGYSDSLNLPSMGEIKLTAYLILTELPLNSSSSLIPIYGPRFLDHAWKTFYHAEAARYSAEQVWQCGIAYAQNQLWYNKKNMKGFVVGIHPGKPKFLKKLISVTGFEFGWCGQNGSLAVSCLHDYLLYKNPLSLEIGLSSLDWWIEHGFQPNGIFIVRFKLNGNRIIPENTPIDACNLSDCILSFLEANELLHKIGTDRPQYREKALKLCDFIIDHQAQSGQLGKSWSITGESIDPNGSIGAFLIPALLLAYTVTNNQKYFHSAQRAYRFYLTEFRKLGFTTAGALDSYCIDKESAFPFVSSALKFYQLTQEKEYLNDAIALSYYLATWQFHHSIPFPKNSILGKIKYNSFGGTSVSAAHHHLDPYGARFYLIWKQLARATGEQIWSDRADTIWKQSLLGVSDGNFSFGTYIWPKGAQNEAAYHTWFGTRNSISEWYVAWPTAFRLEMLRHEDDWSKFP
jgi:hypothetical protein